MLAVTGGIYIFKSEVEHFRNSKSLSVEPKPNKLSYDEQVVSAKRSLPEGYNLSGIEVSSSPNVATVLLFTAPKQPSHRLGVDPYTGKVLGEVAQNKFFPWILKLHRNMFLGLAGRIITELATSWTIVLAVTGLYLWLPKRIEKWKGVWAPRLKGKPYVVLRDLHTVAGFYLTIPILIMCLTGLLYSYAWGSSYRYLSAKTGAGKFFSSAPKTVGDHQGLLSVDRVVQNIRQEYSYQPLSIFFPRRAGDSITIFARGETGPNNHGYMVLSANDASVLLNKQVNEFPVATQWATWNYSLHVGSFGGLTTKILWFLGCVVLACLPITGLWMWIARRPKGKTGFPKRTIGPLPLWVKGTIFVSLFFLPVFGISLVAILLLDQLVIFALGFTQRYKSRIS